MPILIAAVSVVGVLCTLDLVLTFGVIRRLREHTTLLSAVSPADVEVTRLHTGELPEEFTVSTSDGDLIDSPAGLRIVAFFSASCSVCPGRVPTFVDYLARHSVPAAHTLAVVCGDPTAPAPYVPVLRQVARVSLQPEGGEIEKAFKIAGFPAFCLLGPDGTLTASGYDPASLPEPVAV